MHDDYTEITRLLDFKLYHVFMLSFLRQIGVVAILFIPAAIVLWRGKKHGMLIFLSLNIILIPLFHMALKAQYTGYSRFMLLLVPVFLAAANITFSYIAEKNKRAVLIIVSSCIAVNIYMTPLNFDGTKKSFWGNPIFDTSEHYYPYRKMIRWLKKNYNPGKNRVLFANNGYPYRGLQFYLLKFNWHPFHLVSNDTDLTDICRKAEKSDIDVIVFKPPPDHPEYQPELGCDYNFEHKVRNTEHSLITYKRADQTDS
ncbi:MAG: hypothetical protein U5L07_02705 [Desulfobacterales bacterium]|nr:hypothetical protein [Desulfobacterales bacterium]